MFQFRRFPTHTYLFSIRRMAINHAGFPIRISKDQSLLSAPRGFSQIAASFVGSWCQGIPLTLFVAWPNLLESCFCSSVGCFSTIINIVVITLKYFSYHLSLIHILMCIRDRNTTSHYRCKPHSSTGDKSLMNISKKYSARAQKDWIRLRLSPKTV